MKIQTISLVAALATVLTQTAVRAQDAGQRNAVPTAPAPVTSPMVDPQLKADILRLLEATHTVDKAQAGMHQAFEAMRPQLLESLPDTPNREKIASTYEDNLVALTKTPEFTDRVIEVFSKYFSDDDVKALAAFYETPAGQHFVDHSGDVTTDSMKAGQEIATENLTRIFSELCKEYPELQGQADFCPAVQDKKSQIIPTTTERPVTAGLSGLR